ncbi:MAG: energy-coupling factor transporter transmembrane component T [Spirochaetia bacterium]|jgi:energy-coupling factor transport system permease protein|nr:energy-coupling factor transporter transmembrane component T [Spirochaetia bacterium]
MKTPDPRCILLISACISTLAVFIDTVWLLACIFIFTALLGIVLGVNLLSLLHKTRKLLSVIFFIAIMESVFNPNGIVIIHLGRISLLTEGGLLKGTAAFLRMGLVLVSAVFFTLFTNRVMIQGLIQLRIPYEFAFMASVALRFLPVFTEEFQDNITAIQLRGVNFNKIDFKEKIRMYRCVLLPVIYGAIDRAQKLSIAMELRAFRAYSNRTSRFVLKFSFSDYLFMFIMILITAGIFLFDYLFL